jgi:hypothetical protein
VLQQQRSITHFLLSFTHFQAFNITSHDFLHNLGSFFDYATLMI